MWRYAFRTIDLFRKASFIGILLAVTLGYQFSVKADAFLLSIGVGRVDAKQYKLNVAALNGPENDAVDATNFMANWPTKRFAILLNETATRTNVLEILDRKSQTLQSNDLLVVYFSGHGGEVPDPHADATNGMDQTWCLYDGQLLDKELYGEWAKFPAGVRIVLVSDSCHSAGISKLTFDMAERIESFGDSEPFDSKKLDVNPEAIESFRRAENEAESFDGSAHNKIKTLTPKQALDVYLKNRDYYRGLLANLPATKAPILAEVLSISACGDNQLAADSGPFRNSIFTRSLLSYWNGGTYKGSYVLFVKDVSSFASVLNPDQVVAARMIDQNDKAFWHQRPFTYRPPVR